MPKFKTMAIVLVLFIVALATWDWLIKPTLGPKLAGTDTIKSAGASVGGKRAA